MGSPRIILATGGRDFKATNAHRRELAEHLAGAVALFHGDCPTGFDRFAGAAAHALRIPVIPVPALWAHDGPKRAGPIRSARMLRWALDLSRELELPLEGVVGPGGRGTAGMLAKLRREGVEVIEVCHPHPAST